MYLAILRVSQMKDFSIDEWNPKSVLRKRGYQRKPDERKIRSIAKYFEDLTNIMPVAGLLNLRGRGNARYGKGQLSISDPW